MRSIKFCCIKKFVKLGRSLNELYKTPATFSGWCAKLLKQLVICWRSLAKLLKGSVEVFAELEELKKNVRVLAGWANE